MLFQDRCRHPDNIDIAQRRQRRVERDVRHFGVLPGRIKFAQPEMIPGTKIGQSPLAIPVLHADTGETGANHQHPVWIFTLFCNHRFLGIAALPLSLERDIPVKSPIGFKQNLVDNGLQGVFIETREHDAFLQMRLQRVFTVSLVNHATPAFVILAQFPQALPSNFQQGGFLFRKNRCRPRDPTQRGQLAKQRAVLQLGSAMLVQYGRHILQEDTGIRTVGTATQSLPLVARYIAHFRYR